MNIPQHKAGDDEIPRSALVTGGTGFVGAYVIRDLVQGGWSVRATRRSGKLPAFIDRQILDKVEWADCDILDTQGLSDCMEGVHCVVHAAAKVSFHPSDRAEMFSANIQGTANVVNAAIEANVRRLVHVSSIAAIGRRSDGGTVNENQKWQKGPLTTSYSLSKYHAEMEVWRGMAEGLNAVIVNPSTVIGYGDWNISSCRIFRNVYGEFPWYTNGINGFVGVEDVSAAIVKLMRSDIRAERFIVNADNWSYRQLLNTIADGFGKQRPHKEATPLLSAFAWRLEKLKSAFTGKKPLLTRETARIGRSNTRFANDKIRSALTGFSFTPLEKVIADACKKYMP